MRKHKFEQGEYYHIYNRGVDKRNIFLGPKFYERFKLGLREFNSNKPSKLTRSSCSRLNLEHEDLGMGGDQEKLVDVVLYCFMPNHFHLLIRENKEGGITEFMRKLGTGYTMYFNKKNKRTGSLFEGRFKAVHISKDEYLRHLFVYIHINPLDLVESKWKENGILNINDAIKFIEGYKWSSYKNYIKDDFSDKIINKETFPNYWKNNEEMMEFIRNWIGKNNEEFLKDLILE